MTTALQTDPKRDGGAAVGIPVDRRVRLACKHCGGTTGFVYLRKTTTLTGFRGGWGEAPAQVSQRVQETESFASCVDCGSKYRVPALERSGRASKPNV